LPKQGWISVTLPETVVNQLPKVKEIIRKQKSYVGKISNADAISQLIADFLKDDETQEKSQSNKK